MIKKIIGPGINLGLFYEKESTETKFLFEFDDDKILDQVSHNWSIRNAKWLIFGGR